MVLLPVIVFIAGLVLLAIGAELVLRGSSRLAVMLGVRPIVLGLTVVTVGNSLPELAIGLTAGAEGRDGLVVGNIAGTNIFNILFILGLTALIRPLPIQPLSGRLGAPAMLAATVALIAMSLDGRLGRIDGLLLLAAALAYSAAVVRMSRRASPAVKREFYEEFGAEALLAAPGAARLASNALLLLAGIAVIALGAQLLVSGAVDIARTLGVSDAIIGLTIVAMGTSAPELATTIVATIKNDRDIAVGNLVGSSLYNILVILGATCIAIPGGIAVGTEILRLDLPFAAAVALACLAVFRSGRVMSRTEGACFVGAYLAYLGTLIART